MPDKTKEPNISPKAKKAAEKAYAAQSAENRTAEIPPPENPPDTDEWKDKALRAQADLVNFRSRTQKELSKSWADSRADTLKSLLPVLDNLDRAAGAECSDEAYKQGVELTLRQFLEILDKFEVSEIEALEQPFDPNLMDAVIHETDENFGESTVAQVFSKGYKMGDRVLRPATVKVVN